MQPHSAQAISNYFNPNILSSLPVAPHALAVDLPAHHTGTVGGWTTGCPRSDVVRSASEAVSAAGGYVIYDVSSIVPSSARCLLAAETLIETCRHD